MGRSMKDSGVEWIGEIPEDWEVRTIGQLYNPRSEKVSDLDYEPLSVTKNGIVLQLETAAKSKNHNDRKLVLKGDFVINSRSDRKMSAGTSPYDGSVSLINTVLYSDIVSSEYSHYLLKNYGFAEEFYRWGTGIVADLWSTNFERMKKIAIPLPNTEKQKKIASFLAQKNTYIDSIIKKTKGSIDAFKRYKQALITETVTKGLNTDVPMKDSGIEWIGMIPEHWEVRRIKDFIKFDPPKSEVKESDLEKECTFLPMENLRNGIINLSQTRIIKDVYSGYSYFKDGDIVLAKVTPCFENGNIAVSRGLANGLGFGTTEIFTIRPISIDVNFLFYRLQEEMFVEKGKSAMYGVGGLKRLPPEFIRSYKIAVPPISEQQQIAAYLGEKISHINSLIQNKETMVAKLEEYKKSLIYEYVTGKKEVE